MTTKTLHLDSVIQRAPSALSTEADGAFIMMDVHKGLYFCLSKVSARIWEQLTTPQRVSDICLCLQKEYIVSATTCQTEVLSFAQQLFDNGLISEQTENGQAH